jgi:hypothetical protein
MGLIDGRTDPAIVGDDRILHVIVGHGLPVLFLNTVDSFRAVCPRSELLVIDNRSPQASLRADLARRAEADPAMQLLLRDTNDPANSKVGELYEAYRCAFDIARRRGFDYVHLLQGDMQVMWWDEDARRKLAELYLRHPRCVNIHTRALSSDRTLMRDIVVDAATRDAVLAHYGMTDTGLYDLARWDESGMVFATSETATSAIALERGLEVVVSPWPTEVPVPWPAVVRSGRQVGREVTTAKPFLCRPLDDQAVAAIKTAGYPVPWEEMCVPWGWSCLAPMSETDLSKWYYLNYRRRAILRHGWRQGAPRWITEGLDRRVDRVLAPHRPALLALLLRPVPSFAGEVVRRLFGRLVLRSRPSCPGSAR